VRHRHILLQPFTRWGESVRPGLGDLINASVGAFLLFIVLPITMLVLWIRRNRR
jgi:hypothetical protein